MPDSLRTLLDESLGTAYTIERELGGGGMSRVFLAEERELGRKVVIKVLAPDLAEGLSTDRLGDTLGEPTPNSPRRAVE